jgi:hypothetical protein
VERKSDILVAQRPLHLLPPMITTALILVALVAITGLDAAESGQRD